MPLDRPRVAATSRCWNRRGRAARAGGGDLADVADPVAGDRLCPTVSARPGCSTARLVTASRAKRLARIRARLTAVTYAPPASVAAVHAAANATQAAVSVSVSILSS